MIAASPSDVLDTGFSHWELGSELLPTELPALTRMKRALAECIITGVATTIPFQLALLDDPAFRSGAVATTYVADMLRRWKS